MRISAVVPTLGRSPLLIPCLEALRRDESRMEIVVVDQGENPVELPAGLADRVVRPGGNRGFAGGTNAGIAAARGELVAAVNDDLLVEPGWTAALVDALERHPRAAAAQGVNLEMQGERVDGWGLAWNRAWQAVQLGHGEAPPPATAPEREVFGVSATAALYRRASLDAVALPGRGIFDELLGSYYEDADLANRLRAAGWTALAVPAARAHHAGGATSAGGGARSRERWARIYGNRHLVLARLLGTGYWPRLPALAARDLVDLARAVLGGEWARVAGITLGWGRAIRLLPAFARRGELLCIHNC
jgi:GT2 family glycosyltransferase